MGKCGPWWHLMWSKHGWTSCVGPYQGSTVSMAMPEIFVAKYGDKWDLISGPEWHEKSIWEGRKWPTWIRWNRWTGPATHACTWLIAPMSEWTSNWIWIYMYLQTKPELILLNLILSVHGKKFALPKVRNISRAATLIEMLFCWFWF
jgi:hypothetical protein